MEPLFTVVIARLGATGAWNAPAPAIKERER